MTLISYFIFKIRYAKEKKSSNKLFNLEGIFFRRYAPLLEERNKKHQERLTNPKKSPLARRRKLITLYSVITLGIFTFLLLENFFSFRKEISERSKVASNYRELLSKGLLKQYQYVHPNKEISHEEVITPAMLSRRDKLIELLKKINFQLINLKNGHNAKLPVHARAVSNWRDFFTRHKIPYTSISDVSQIKADAVVIVPQALALSKREREILTNLKNPKVFTGNIGHLDGTGAPVPQSFASAFLDITVKENPEPNRYYPTLIARHFENSYDIPAGMLLNWPPLDNQFIFSAENSQSSLKDGDFSSIIRSERFDRSYWSQQKNTLWIQMDPIANQAQITQANDLSLRSSDKFYSDEWILTGLGKFSKNPKASVAIWRKQTNLFPLVLSVDTEHEFEKIQKYLDLFEDYDLRATFFLVSDLIGSNARLISKNKDKHEWASHTADHIPLSQRPEKESFESIQKSRHDIEEISGQEVQGFRPPEEDIASKGLDAILQNRFKYVFAGQQFQRLTPLLQTQNLIHIPRMLKDDFYIAKSKDKVTPEDIFLTLKEDFELAKSMRAPYILSLHTHIFTSEVSKRALKLFFEHTKQSRSEFWNIDMATLAQWWQTRDNLLVEVISTGEKWQLQIENRNEQEIRDFDVILDLPSTLSKKCPHNVINIDALEAGKLTRLDICPLM